MGPVLGGAGLFAFPGCTLPSNVLPMPYIYGYCGDTDNDPQHAGRSTRKGHHMPELRLIDPNGYLVPGTVTNVTADQVEAVKANLLTEAATQDADSWNQFGHRLLTRDYRVQVTPNLLPTAPGRLAELLLAPGADANLIGQQLAAQEGEQRARQLLAAAHDVAADRLFAEAA